MDGYINGDINAELENESSSKMTESGEAEGPSATKRQTWSSQLDFIMTSVGCAVGLGNIWRFPYLCYKNGGGAFLIPYLVSFLFVAAPAYILEISLGQYTSSGCIRAYFLVPAFKGIGFAAQVVMAWDNLYYVIVICWALYYIASSFTSELPWSTCNNPWNTERCFVSGMSFTNCTSLFDNFTNANCTNMTSHKPVDSVVEFWERRALQMSSGIDEMGDLVPGLVAAFTVAWAFVFICVFGGVRWTGKIVYFTAVFPYVLLTVLFFRGVTLDGAADGIMFYIKPDFSRLLDAKVWIDGATQVLYSIGLSQGFMVALGGYNKFHSNSVRNGLIVISINCLTSLYGGFAVFSVLGFMAHEMNLPIHDVVQSGPGLVFQAYPKAVTQLSPAPFWAAVFFLMVLFVGLDSQFVAVEGFLTPIMDSFPKVLYKPRNRTLCVLVYCIVCYLMGLLMVTEGGVYLFRLIDYYSVSGLVLLFICLCELIAIGWVFGGQRFLDVLELMTGQRPGIWLTICWKFVAPFIIVSIFLFELATFKPLKFNQTYEYPAWATAMGALFSLSSTLCIPGFLIYGLFRSRGTLKQRWRALTTPTLKKHQIHPSWVGRSEYRWNLADYNDHDDVEDIYEREDSI